MTHGLYLSVAKIHQEGVWGQEEEARMEKEEGSLGETLHRKKGQRGAQPARQNTKAFTNATFTNTNTFVFRHQHSLRQARVKPGVCGSRILPLEKQRASVRSPPASKATGHPDEAGSVPITC